MLMGSKDYFLIVTSDIDVQDGCVLLLRAQRVPALGVSTCEEAIKVATLTRVGAVLFDIDTRDDWNSLSRFRQELPPAIPVVALSGWFVLDRTDRNRARDLGCAGFVAKPATSTLMCRALQRAAEGSPWSEYIDSPWSEYIDISA